MWIVALFLIMFVATVVASIYLGREVERMSKEIKKLENLTDD